MRVRPRRWLGIAAALWLVGCRSERPPNVLLIVIDTLRADRVGFLGDDRGLTPFLDSLAAESTVFRRAYAQSSWTNPSVASLLTSRYQSQHRVTRYDSVLTDAETSLPEILRRHGYATGAVVANWMLDPKLGFAQGFETYTVAEGDVPLAHNSFVVDPRAKPRARHVHRRSLEWIDQIRRVRPDAPLFLYVQYMEPHTPYGPPAAALERVVGRRGARKEPDAAVEASQARAGTPAPASLTAMQDQYDAEVSDLDTEMRGLFAALEERGVLSHAIVVVTADHGEEFMDHGRIGHGISLCDEMIHVPLLVRTPGTRQRRDVAETVALVDVAPAILALAHLPQPPSFEGRALPLESAPAAPAAPPVYAEQLDRPSPLLEPYRHASAVIVGLHKLLLAPSGAAEFHDLARDPHEQRAGDLDPEAHGTLRLALRQARERARRNPSRPERAPIDTETRGRLRALGYAD